MSFGTTRRQLIGGSLGGLFGFAMRHRHEHLFAAETTRSTKKCIVLWMNGGPSQLETFDPKPGAATGGPTASQKTNVPGIEIASNLPEIAKRMDRLSIIRNLTSPEGDHDRGSYFMHTGYPMVQAFPRPTLGSIVSHENPPSDFPLFVSLGARGLGPAYMGSEHAPFSVEDPAQAVQLITRLRRQRESLRQLDKFNEKFDQGHQDLALHRRGASLQRVERMLTTPFVKALNVETASEPDRSRYGDSDFGKRCLLARNLLVSGVKFVEVMHDGWDTHENNFTSVARLCSEIDQPWAALMDDLQSNGMWEDTVVVWMGEFGRTPQINGNTGRDHFPKITPVVLGGGGLRGGVVVGKTNATGIEIVDESVKVPDLFATLLTAMGMDPTFEFRTEFGAIAPASDHGNSIKQLLI